MRCGLQAPAIPTSLLDCDGKVIEYQERPQRGGGALRPSGSWGKPQNGCSLPCTRPHPTAPRCSLLLTFLI